MTELDNLAAQIQSLSPPDKLRLAAGLMEQRKAKLAHQIAEQVVTELGAVLARGYVRPTATPSGQGGTP